MSVLERLAEVLRAAARGLLGPKLVPAPVPVRVGSPSLVVRRISRD